jgi:DNA-binding GntR family transcriptional regulator
VELASRALPRAHIALIDRLQTINARIAEDIARHDAVGYIRRNLEFHRTLYLRAQAPAMLAMAETVWLQLGPTMRVLYGRLRHKEPPHFHRLIVAALKAGDEPGLRLAMRSDVTQGLRMLVG